MIFPDLEVIASLGEDYEALKGLCLDSVRVQNRRNDFKAPMMVSAHRLKHLNKINELNTDAVIINLEDGVAPELKKLALHYAVIFISNLKQSDKKIIVRVNSLDESAAEEIALLNEVKPDAIRVPKIETVEDVKRVEALVDGDIDIHLSIETASAWKNLAHLRTSERVKAFYLGVLDLLADMHLPHSIIEHHNPTMHYLLSHFLITSKVAGVWPVSFVYQEHEKMETFTRWLELEKSMGYLSKGVISPKQAEAVMEYMGYSQELERACHIIRAFEEQKAKGVTGFSDPKYGFIDEPIYKGALVILKQYSQ